MVVLICDIETDGLRPTVIHCLVAHDPDKGETYTFHNDASLERTGDILAALLMLKQADLLVFHNGIGFDIPTIKRLYPGFTHKTIHDTFVLSQMFFANEMQKHGLEAWGKALDMPKVEHHEWVFFSPQMLERCRVDVEITTKLWEKCKAELDSHDWTLAVELEYETYRAYCNHMTHWYIDADKLVSCITDLETRLGIHTAELEKLAPPQVIRREKDRDGFKKSGERAKWTTGWTLDPEKNLWYKVESKPLNLNSSSQVIGWLLSLGWQPDTWNLKKDKRGKPIKGSDGKPISTSPSLRNSSYNGIPESIKNALISRNEVRHRLSVLNGWLKSLYDDDNKIKTFALTCGTNTGRFKHRGVVNVPKADGEVFYGKEMRSLFIAPEGYVLIGCDAAQLEARIEGHYSYRYDDGKYANFLLSEDIHEFNAKSWGITRSEAKGPGYALAYQCGPAKIQELLKCSLERAQYIHQKYWADRPALKHLIEDLYRSIVARKQAAWRGDSIRLDLSSRPWVKGIDGRKLYVRSAHSLKNTLIQNAGMVAMKWVFIKFADWVSRWNRSSDIRVVMIYHDELQILVCDRPDLIELVTFRLEQIMEEVSRLLGLYVPLKGQVKVGKNWSETH